MADNIYVKVAGQQKQVTAVKTNVSGTWKNVEAAYTKVNGSWKKIFPGTVTIALSGRSSNQDYKAYIKSYRYWYHPLGWTVTYPYNIPMENGIHYQNVSTTRTILGYSRSWYGNLARGSWGYYVPNYQTVVTSYQFNSSNFTGYSRPTNDGDPSPLMFLPEGRYTPTITSLVDGVTSNISVFGVRTRDYQHDTSLPVVKSGTQTIRVSLTGTHAFNLRPDYVSVEVWGATTAKPKSSLVAGTTSSHSNRRGGLANVGYIRPSNAYEGNATPPSRNYTSGPWRKLTNHYDANVGLGSIGSALQTGFQTATVNIPQGQAMYFAVSHGGSIYGKQLVYDITGATIEFTNA